MDCLKAETVMNKDNEEISLYLMHWDWGGFTVQKWSTFKIRNYDTRVKGKYVEVDNLDEEIDYDRKKDGLCGLNMIKKEILKGELL